MSKIKNGGLDQYGAGPFEQQQFGTAGVEGVNRANPSVDVNNTVVGAQKSGALLRFKQPDQAARIISTMDGPHHARVLSSGRLGTRTGPRRQPDV